LQVFDRLSLYFCLKNLENGATAELEPIPVDYEGTETTLQIVPVKDWHVRFAPYPFATSPMEFELDRRLIDKDTWGSNTAFRENFFSQPAQRQRIVVER
jgi:hypothetical protein